MESTPESMQPFNYIKPDEVTSPRRLWSLIRVLEDGDQPDSFDERVAISIGTWSRPTASGKPNSSPVLAVRWNGTQESPNGNPQSRGLPTWFIVPRRLQESVASTLSPENQVLVKCLLDNSAQKW